VLGWIVFQLILVINRITTRLQDAIKAQESVKTTYALPVTEFSRNSNYSQREINIAVTT
jgi:hypothetical protein